MKKVWIVSIQKNQENENEWELMGVFEKKSDARKICKDNRYGIWQIKLNEELPYESTFPKNFERPNQKEYE